MKKFLETLVKTVVRFLPQLKTQIKIAHMRESPKRYAKKMLVNSFTASFAFSFFMLLLLDKLRGREEIGTNILMSILMFAGSFGLMFLFMYKAPSVYIRKREREIDKEVLFAGRYLLVKMQSGVPFFNALIDASKSYGVAGKYFKEIVDDINTGTPIEEALDRAVTYSASKKFKAIIWQLTNALKTGIDTTDTLKAILDEIAKEQVIEIKKYGKKLNSLAMFYMLIGIVIPSLGMAMFIVLTSFIEFTMTPTHLVLVILLLTFMQFMFVAMFRSIRPNVNM